MIGGYDHHYRWLVFIVNLFIHSSNRKSLFKCYLVSLLGLVWLFLLTGSESCPVCESVSLWVFAATWWIYSSHTTAAPSDRRSGARLAVGGSVQRCLPSDAHWSLGWSRQLWGVGGGGSTECKRQQTREEESEEGRCKKAVLLRSAVGWNGILHLHNLVH